MIQERIAQGVYVKDIAAEMRRFLRDAGQPTGRGVLDGAFIVLFGPLSAHF